MGKAIINASAITSGKGGTVAIYSTGTTTVSASISAKGGIVSGQGGGGGDLGPCPGLELNLGECGSWRQLAAGSYDLTVDKRTAAAHHRAQHAGRKRTNVTLQTTAVGTSGPGNANPSGSGASIFINAPLSWNTNAALTLDAYHGILVNAPITITGAGVLNLYVNDGSSGGDHSFSPGAGDVNYSSTNSGER